MCLCNYVSTCEGLWTHRRCTVTTRFCAPPRRHSRSPLCFLNTSFFLFFVYFSSTHQCSLRTLLHISALLKCTKKFMTLAFLQGQAIYQILHILVSITQPIVESRYFSRFIWPSGEVDSFCLTPRPLNATGHQRVDRRSSFWMLQMARENLSGC